MKNTKPISTSEINNTVSGIMLEECVSYLNDGILSRYFYDDDDDYYKIKIAPYGRFGSDVLDETINLFLKNGWDVKWEHCYNGHGPHTCFFVAKHHFKGNNV